MEHIDDERAKTNPAGRSRLRPVGAVQAAGWHRPEAGMTTLPQPSRSESPVATWGPLVMSDAGGSFVRLEASEETCLQTAFVIQYLTPTLLGGSSLEGSLDDRRAFSDQECWLAALDHMKTDSSKGSSDDANQPANDQRPVATKAFPTGANSTSPLNGPHNHLGSALEPYNPSGLVWACVGKLSGENVKNTSFIEGEAEENVLIITEKFVLKHVLTALIHRAVQMTGVKQIAVKTMAKDSNHSVCGEIMWGTLPVCLEASNG